MLGKVERDVTYCTIDGVDLKMDVYHPGRSDDGPAPVAVFVHGGAWTSGDKSAGTGMADFDELVRRGYLVASLDYRLAPQYQFPAQIQDVKCAIRSLRANAARWGIDPGRIGAWGSSAGGHLVSLQGLTGAGAGWDTEGQYLDQASRVQAVVDLFGPSDLTAPDITGLARPLAARVFGVTSPNDPKLVQASPVTYISRDDPPFLILQGDRDQTVPMSQSQELYDRLVAAGVEAKLVIVRNAGHGFIPVGGRISPGRSELTRMIADFFDEHLKKR